MHQHNPNDFVPPPGRASRDGRPATPGPRGSSFHRGNAARKIGSLLALLALVAALGLGGLTAWRWVDAALLHWGVGDGSVQTVGRGQLLQRVRAFELATVKQTYAGESHITADKVVAAGPMRVALPGWIAGQQLDVKGRATVTAGVDLSRVGTDDMEVTRNGKDIRVIIHVPAPQVLSTELVPNSLDMIAHAGLISRLGLDTGIGENDLRNRAADLVAENAREAAVRNGILEDAARETQQRLQAFLQSLPAAGGHVTYAVEVAPPPGG